MQAPTTPKQVLNNFEELTPTERKVILAIRQLRLFDKIEIKFAEKNKLQWQLTRTDRAVYNMFDGDNKPIV